MRKFSMFLLAGLMTLSLFANDKDKEKAKPVVSNYQEVLSQVKYPTVCREKGIEGTVLIKITVDRAGDIKRYRILEAPCSDLKAAVKEVLPLLEFEPAMVDDQAVSSKIVIPVNFQLTY